MKNFITSALMTLFLWCCNAYFSYAKETLPLFPSNNAKSIGEYLNADGTLNLTKGFVGSLNLSGFDIRLDAHKGIVATPKTTTLCEEDAPPPLAFTWSSINSGLDGACFSMAVLGTDVYVGGFFTTAGGVGANNIAKWNGSTWSALGTGLNSTCSSLAVLGTDIYAGGSFTTAGGVSANRIAKWNGSAWSALGSGFDEACRSLAVLGTDIYAAGYFTTADGMSASRIAKWNGSTWSALGAGLDNACFAVAVSGTDIYATGFFTTAGGVSANYIAKWDGSAWSALGSGLDAQGYSLAVLGSDVYVGGQFGMAGGVSANYIAKWNGSAWSALGSGLNENCYAIAISGTDIYAGGVFTTAGGANASYIAKWNGSSWSALSTGLNESCRAIVMSGTDLYAGGFFTTAGGTSANYIAKSVDVVLPIESTSFEGKNTEGGNLLTWQTANESNNKGFEVERLNGTNWQNMGFVKGNNKASTYQFTDNTPLSISTYRLKQIDNDGKETLSKAITIVKEGKGLKVYPTLVANGILTVVTARDEATEGRQLLDFSITNLLGQQVLSGKITQQIDVSTLAKGTYVLKMGTEVTKFVKQ